MYSWYNCTPKISQTVHYTNWTLLFRERRKDGASFHESHFPSRPACCSVSRPKTQLPLGLTPGSRAAWLAGLVPRAAAPGSAVLPDCGEAQSQLQSEEGRSVQSMHVVNSECLQAPPRDEICTGVDRIPLCRLTNFAKCFLDCLKFFQDFKRCIRLSLQI